MHSGSSPSDKEKLKSWLRYYEDLGIGAFYRDRAPTYTATEEPVAGTEQRDAIEVASAKTTPPAQIQAAAPKFNLVGRGPSLFEAAERVEGDSLEGICGELAGCTRCKL